MNLNLVGEPGVSAFLRSVLQNLDDIKRMKPTSTTYLYYDPRKDMENLKKKLLFFLGLVVDADAKRLDDPCVDQWMDDLNDLLYDVEDIFDDIKSLWKDQVSVDYPLLEKISNCINSQFKKILDRAKILGEEAKELELKRIKSESKQPSITLHTRATSSTVDTSEVIHGREKDKDIIKKRLLEVDDKGKNYDVVGIWGMGGLGKTTLARQVYNDPVFSKNFEVRRWVCISDVFDVVRAFKGLIGDGSAGGDESLEILHERLNEIVENKRFLFVLDDVWPSTDWNMKWDTLKVPFNSCQNGSKILVTTRDCNIAHALGDEKPYQLKGLLHVKCISLFKDKAFGNGDVDEGEMEKLMIWGEKIVTACKGLPLAVKVTGSMLQRSKEEKWRAVSEKANLWDMTDIKDGIHPAIRLSYHYLPASLKRCFEYLAVFPPDYKFDQDDVVRLWIADGLVQDVDGTLAEDIGREYYNELKARSLIQENDMMHDIVHHLASIVCKKFYYKENSEELPASARHAFLVKLNAVHCEFLAQASCLRTLIVEKSDANVLLNAIKSCKVLRTLKIYSYMAEIWRFSHVESCLHQLSHIRYLCIPNSDIRHLPDSLCMLSNLQFLDLGRLYYLENLPDRIHQLSNLRFLDVYGSPILSLPDSICFLSQLQVLDMNGCEGHKQLPKDIGNVRSLRILDLGRNTSISSLPKSICTLGQLLVLNLRRCGSLKELPNDIGTLKSLGMLDISYTSISCLPESICALGQLQLLNLQKCVSVKELPEDMGTLRSLLILNLRKTSISSLPESICALGKLKDLKIKRCGSLKELPKDIGTLRSVRKLDLSYTSISCLPESICALSQLQVLNLHSCGSLKHLPEDIGNLRSLRKLDLICTSILSIPESILNVIGLQELLFDEEKSLPLHIRSIARLEKLRIYRMGTPDYERDYDGHNAMNRLGDQLVIAMENIGGVKEAKMASLKRKKFIRGLEFQWSQPGNDGEMEVNIMEALQPHRALESLTFSNYGGDKLPAWMLSSKICLRNLVELKMEGLNKICEIVDMKFVLLKGLWIESCPRLKKVLMATPKLEKLSIMNCGELEADSVHLFRYLSGKPGLLSIVCQLKKLECTYNIFEYFFEKLKTANLKWDELRYIKLNAEGRRVASLPSGWPSMVKIVREIKICNIGPGKFLLVPDGDGRAFSPSLYFELYINDCCIQTPLHSYIITSDGKVEREGENTDREEVEESVEESEGESTGTSTGTSTDTEEVEEWEGEIADTKEVKEWEGESTDAEEVEELEGQSTDASTDTEEVEESDTEEVEESDDE